jgi:hypothetical protein
MNSQTNEESLTNVVDTEATRIALLGALSTGQRVEHELLAHLQAICDSVTNDENASAADELQNAGPNSHEIGVFSYIPPSFWAESDNPVTRKAAWAAELALDNISL